MQKDELLALAKRVEALNGPDMEIFYKVRDALWPYDPATPIEDQLPALLARQQFDRFIHAGAYLNAAETLVPGNCLTLVKELWNPDLVTTSGYAIINRYEQDGETKRWNGDFHAACATPALALCAAALRALAWGE